MNAPRPVVACVAPPTEPPVSLAAVKARLRIDHADDDSWLAGVLAATVGLLDGPDGLLGRCIVAQTWEQRFPAFCNPLPLHVAPVATVVSVTYVDAAGASQTVSSDAYELVPRDRRAVLYAVDGWPATSARRALPVTVRTTCGYGPASAVPAALTEAIFQHVGTLYERRDALDMSKAIASPLGFAGLIEPFAIPTT